MSNDQQTGTSVIDEVSGTVDILVGKMTGNEDKVREGREKKLGGEHDRERKEKEDDHPGISYTQSGAMRQTCLGRPPPGDDQVELPTDETASIHQHAEYAGPNLTGPPPQHHQTQELKLDSPAGSDRLGAYDLHGGFPTGAPSPGARGAEVIDPFDKVDQGTGTVGVRQGQSGVGDVDQAGDHAS